MSSGTACAVWLRVSLQPLSVPVFCVSQRWAAWWQHCCLCGMSPACICWGEHMMSFSWGYKIKKYSPVPSWDHCTAGCRAGCMLVGLAQEQQVPTGLCLASEITSVWKGSDLAFGSVHKGGFSDGFCLPQNFVSESPNYLLMIVCRAFVCTRCCLCQQRQETKFQWKTRALPSLQKLWIVPLFLLFPHFLYWELVDLDTVLSLMFKVRQKQNLDFPWVVENVSWPGVQMYPSLGLFCTGIKSSWDLAQSHSWKIPF